MDSVKTLELLTANPSARSMSRQAHALLNANIANLLAAGFVSYAPGKRCGYTVTPRGMCAISSARTGVPMPKL